MNRQATQQALQAKAHRIWDKFTRSFPKLRDFVCPTILLNGRYTRSAGMCYYEQNRIDISLKYFLFHENIVSNDILIHELAHQVQYNIYGKKAMKALNGHGIEWQNIMKIYGAKPDRFHYLSIPPMKLAEMMEIYNGQ